MPIKELLTELSEATGPSGYEAKVRSTVRRELERYADEVFVTNLGSIIGVKRSRAGKNGRVESAAHKVLFEGHMDEIALIVSGFDHGYIRFDQIGGYDARVLKSQNVLVHARETLPGVIASPLPIFVPPEDRDKPTPMDELYIDVGLPEARLRELVTVGDVITIDAKVVSLRNNLLAGKAFDDRAAVVTVLDALRQLDGARLPWDAYFVANVQEEDGAWFSGAFTSTYRIRPEVAIALDVSHGDQPGVGDVNTVALDKGPGIARGPNIHPAVHARLVQTARRIEIPYRVTAYPGPTGTNAWAMQVVAEGIPTGLIDLPLRYMHTPVETLSVADLERSARLLAAFATELDDEFLRAVQGQPMTPTRTEASADKPKAKTAASRKRTVARRTRKRK